MNDYLLSRGEAKDTVAHGVCVLANAIEASSAQFILTKGTTQRARYFEHLFLN